MFGFPFTAMPIVCLVLYFENSVRLSFALYSFIVSNTNVHTLRFVCLFVWLSFFMSILSTWSWPAISTIHMYVYECCFSAIRMPFVWHHLWFLFCVFRCVDTSSTVLTLTFWCVKLCECACHHKISESTKCKKRKKKSSTNCINRGNYCNESPNNHSHRM